MRPVMLATLLLSAAAPAFARGPIDLNTTNCRILITALKDPGYIRPEIQGFLEGVIEGFAIASGQAIQKVETICSENREFSINAVLRQAHESIAKP